MNCIKTPRLVLQDYTAAEFTPYFLLKSHKETMRYLPDIRLHTLAEAQLDFETLLADMQSPDRRFYFFHIKKRDTGETVGSMGYTVIGTFPVGKVVHAGYFLYPEFWNRGYATEALRAVLRFAFAENGVYRLNTGCLEENAGSARVMEKCGLVREGRFPAYTWHEGQMKTRLQYRLLKEEWAGAPVQIEEERGT